MKKDFSFELITHDDKARLGKIYTSRGTIDTPTFMPVGTQGTVKGIFTDDILNWNSDNFRKHLSLIIKARCRCSKKFKGLHNFMNWKKPILTDSGGYQIMSLSNLNKIDKDIGAIFKSHIDGKKIILSPEKVFRYRRQSVLI